MIDEEKTFEKFGYRSTNLSEGSSKLIVAVCDICKKERTVHRSNYGSICRTCANKKRKGIPKTDYSSVFSFEDLKDKYEKNRLSSVDIGKIYGCDSSIILYHLRKFKIPVRSHEEVLTSKENREKISKALGGKPVPARQGSKHHSYNLLITPELLRKYEKEEFTPSDLAKVANCSNVTITNRLRKSGISIRGPKKAKSTQRHKEKVCGPNHWNWKGGISSLSLPDEIRSLPEYQDWRITCLERSGFTCTGCGRQEVKLEVHHEFKPFQILFLEFLQHYPHLSPIEDKKVLIGLAIVWKSFWNVDNGKVLCEDCHDEKREETIQLIEAFEVQSEEKLKE